LLLACVVMAQLWCVAWWSFELGLEEQISAEALRNARDASSAHLEAVLKVDGASYLRLAHLRDVLGPSEKTELKSAPGVRPQLWLDMAHRLTMEPDAKTYRLAHHGVDKIDVLLETEQLDEAVAAARNVLAHHKVEQLRRAPTAAAAAQRQWITMLYVWLTGFVTGVALLAIYLIYMKKLPF
jgi:hypothetical protein